MRENGALADVASGNAGLWPWVDAPGFHACRTDERYGIKNGLLIVLRIKSGLGDFVIIALTLV